MSRLIDADALYKDICRAYDECDDILEIIDKQPTIEPQKGKWIPHIEKSREYIGTILVNVQYDYWLCDTCGYRVKNGQPTYNFCPHCGADNREV